MGISNLKDIAKTTFTTSSNSPWGTFPYMAPELFCRGHRGPPVDVYAFGCLIIKVFGGIRVWKGLTGPEIIQKVCGTFRCAPTPPPVDHLPTVVRSVCSACCSLEPAERPPIADVIQLLRNIC